MQKTLISLAVWLAARVARIPFVRRFLVRVIDGYRRAKPSSSASAMAEVPEVTPLQAIPVSGQGRRINVLINAISPDHVFGGISTAMQVFDRLRMHFDEARIIVTDEVFPQAGPNTFYRDWPVHAISNHGMRGNHVVAAGSRAHESLEVHANDYFLATAWWTAHLSLELLDWQRAQFELGNHRRIAYLIQDYEPGFYNWSTRYVLAANTYQRGADTLAIMNSQWLADFFVHQGLGFSEVKVLHPVLHPALLKHQQRSPRLAKERVLLVYARPGTDRNVFGLVVAALRRWVAIYPAARDWQILGAGEPFEPVALGDGVVLQSLGKLSLDAYADLLKRAALGLSLMISPHPSYPPLEMAAFGVRVVTNRYANKDLSAFSPDVISVAQVDAPHLASALLHEANTFDKRAAQEPVVLAHPCIRQESYLSSDASWHWVDELVDVWT